MGRMIKDVFIKQTLKGDSGMKFGKDLQDFSGTLQHPNGDLLQVTKGVLVRQISPGDADYDSLQTGFLSTQDEFAMTIMPDGTITKSPLPSLRQPGERETLRGPEHGSGPMNSNQDMGDPNFQTSLGGGGVLRDPYRSSGQRMVNSESVQNAGSGESYQGESLPSDGMYDPSAADGGRELTPVRNVARSYQQPEYEFDTSVADAMHDALKEENQKRYLREGA